MDIKGEYIYYVYVIHYLIIYNTEIRSLDKNTSLLKFIWVMRIFWPPRTN